MQNVQPVEKIVHGDEGYTLDVHSVFLTIQGEGPYVGRRAVFVRLAGCNLQCPQCDTDYTTGRSRVATEDLARRCAELHAGQDTKPLVVITGGEPLRQPIGRLLDKILSQGFDVQLETNGTAYQALPYLHPSLTVVCAPKTGRLNGRLLPHIDALKYVITAGDVDPRNGLPYTALGHTASPRLALPPPNFRGTVYVQPCDEQDSEKNAANLAATIDSVMRFGYTLCLQTHKYIGME